ncbi:hypothetical protein PG997_007122, partial [Apiospora hydei]
MDNLQSLNWTLINEMAASLTQEQRDQAEWRMRNSSRLPMSDYQASFFALASLAFVGRIAIRVWSRHRLSFDDAFLSLGYVSLTVATIIFYVRARLIYYNFALVRGDLIISLIASQEMQDVLDQKYWSFFYMALMFAAIFLVKLSYFALFRPLLRQMPKAFIRYYWASVVLTVVSGIFLALVHLIICPYFGTSS